MYNNNNKEGRRNEVVPFDDFFDSMLNAWGVSTSKIPAVDIEEGKNEYKISAELPGFDQNDVNVYVEKHVLHIASVKKSEQNEKDESGKKYLVRERRQESFERSFTLPEDVDEESISAAYKNGLLELAMPKKVSAVPKKIDVKIN